MLNTYDKSIGGFHGRIDHHKLLTIGGDDSDLATLIRRSEEDLHSPRQKLSTDIRFPYLEMEYKKAERMHKE